MNGATVFQMPTMTNPQALHTVEELRAELHRANNAQMRLGMQLADLQASVQGLVNELAPVILAYSIKDADALANALRIFCDKRVRVAAPGAPTGTVQ